MQDLYKTLGVSKTASDAEIKAGYRKLAKQYHPDLNPDDKAIEQKFKEISQAYNILGDAKKKQQYDRGQIDATGQASNPFHGGYTHRGQPRGATAGGNGGFDFGNEMDIGDIFSDLFGARKRQTRTSPPQRKGSDVKYTCSVNFVEAAAGAIKRIDLADGKSLNITIPPGTEDKQVLRLKTKGLPGVGGGPNGDALIEVRIESHPLFSRKGRDVYLDLPISLTEALEGTTLTVPTVTGRVKVRIPPDSNTGTTLRLKGKGIDDIKGVNRGDQLIRLQVYLPDETDKELRDFIRNWAKTKNYDPRKHTGLFE
ncbi:DnaJ domain-containing protein [Kiloniella laminariae]|uniref:DnaJ domain-containing protein n=1 Tax=Kiloniella laminariae TaxID=454162 RepID=A0ABT4LE38_9PROT|nr:DnaJ C-terminal domain-containing protein [Kiloniella laminariae]MCZ4279354.1 DnaJ domain-containing protein [Kiloniella laminariae]